jgi:hypothetical protein
MYLAGMAGMADPADSCACSFRGCCGLLFDLIDASPPNPLTSFVLPLLLPGHLSLRDTLKGRSLCCCQNCQSRCQYRRSLVLLQQLLNEFVLPLSSPVLLPLLPLQL